MHTSPYIYTLQPLMATTILNHYTDHFTNMTISTSKPSRVCFSYAAYAKNLIQHLQESNIPVEPGLSDDEFSKIESSLNFIFPPDLRAILQEGLPVGPGFPNWRSSSKQQLEILTSLPVLGICKEVSRNGYWAKCWGERPNDVNWAVKLVNGLLKIAPVLVPVYQNLYIPSKPVLAGNPVFYVNGVDVRVWSFDVVGFFQRAEFGNGGLLVAPAWAAKEARRIRFWTEMARGNRCSRVVAREGWWGGELGGCLEEVWCMLRDGGWKDEDVKEMMMMDGCDEVDGMLHLDEPFDRERVRLLSERLLRAGWSREDVVESLGFIDDVDSCFDFHHNVSKSDNQNKSTLMKLMGLSVLP